MPAATPFVPKIPPLRDGVERELPPAQYRMLRAVYDHQARHGVTPTVRELNVALGITSPNGVLCSVRALQRKGYLYRGEVITARNIMLGVKCFELSGSN